MPEATDTDTVGFVTFDSELRVTGCNEAFLRLVRTTRDATVNKAFEEVFGSFPFLQTIVQICVDRPDMRVRKRSFPHVFKHWPKWEEHSYDLTVYSLGTGALLRISEAIPKPEEKGVTNILRHTAGAGLKPLFSGEDSTGRAIDVYVHPAGSYVPDRLVLLSVYRDTHHSATFEVPSSMLSRIVLAHLLHVKS